MRRREFIGLFGGAAAWPLAARAQHPKPPTIGFLGSGTLAGQGEWVAAFVRRLRELGWIDGRNLAIEYRWAEGSSACRSWSCSRSDLTVLPFQRARPGERRCAHRHGSSLAAWNQRQHDLAV